MKKLFFIALFIFITGSVYSQDLIVTNDGDSINCKITKVSAGIIYFAYKQNDEIRNTFIPTANVKIRRLNYYQMSEVTRDIVGFYNDYQSLRIAVYGGFSYHTAKMSEGVQSDLKDYNNKLRSGYNFGADFTYFYSESFGSGLKYNLFNSSNSMYYNGNSQYDKISDNIKISFIGPSFSIRQFNSYNDNAFLMSFSLGYLGYVDDAVIVDDFRITGSTLGLSLGVGYDIKLSEDLSLGFQLLFLKGTLNSIELSDGIHTQEFNLEEGNYESLNRIDLSVGLVFGK